MKQKVLLSLGMAVLVLAAPAQKKSQPLTGYAITAIEKGHHKWSEVKLVDLKTGEAVQAIYNSAAPVKALNARTGKPIVKKDAEHSVTKPITFTTEGSPLPHRSTLTGNDGQVIIEIEKQAAGGNNLTKLEAHEKRVRKVFFRQSKQNQDAPFATNSAACAYDKKHGRLYYTPMGINQLRYIDLKANTPTVYYFEEEPFGVVTGLRDVPNQVTRMVIAADGNGYALSNNGEHLLKFTTKKKPVITDLGSLTDDAGNGKFSIHSPGGYGGDMVAGESGNLYLITASRRVFNINPETLTATYMGSVKGLPQGYSTNGAMVEKGTSIIVTSATSTSGYYRFDLKTLQAEKISTAADVFNASDLASATLLTDKKKKGISPQEQPAVAEPNLAANGERALLQDNNNRPGITVYPNPVSNGQVNISFEGYTNGKYELQLLDLSGQRISSQSLVINGKTQLQEFKLPVTLAKGTYLVKVLGENNKTVNVEKIVVQ